MAEDNWGRWGAADERGALNWLSAERVVGAARLVRTGRVFSLAMPLGRQTPMPPHRLPPARYMDRDGGDYAAGAKRPGGVQFAEETLHLCAHSGTHMDSLAHVWYGDRLYNGFSGNTIRSTTGAQHCSIDKAGPVVGRGVLLDLARHFNQTTLPMGHEISGADMEACAQRQGVAVGEGDIVLVRTGWIHTLSDPAQFFGGEPGPGPDGARWLAERHVAAVGADNYAFEVYPMPRDELMRVHRLLLRDCGIPILEGLLLDELAEAGVHEFLFVCLPLPIEGGTGSPVNPVAIV